MKIDNSRIFTADVYRVAYSAKNERIKESLKHGDVFGSYGYDSWKTNTGMVVI